MNLNSTNMALRSTFLATLCSAMIAPCTMQAQVLTDFEDGIIDQWLTEADGVPSLSASGNPGNCIRVTDQVLSVINQMVLPWAYTGDWSAAQTNDSLSFDLFAHPNNYDPLESEGLPLITISGPGGSAVAYIDTVPVFDTWQHFSIALDSAAWLVTGSWTALLAEVQTVKVRTEFNQGSEWVELDNVLLTIAPLIEPLVGTVCSTWDSAGFYDGWSFQSVGSIQVSMDQGNPPGSVRMGDAANALTNAVAAPKFRGDWTDLDMQANMTFDLFLQTSSSNYIDKDYLVRMSGPGGAAKFNCNDSLTALLVNQWHTVEIPIDAPSWELLSGTWSGLLDFVAEIRLELEFIDGTGEVVYLDNFCLNTGITTGTPEPGAEGSTLLYPNPTSGQFTLQPAAIADLRTIQVMDASGRTVLSRSIANNAGLVHLDLSNHAKGLYQVRIGQADGTYSMARLIVE